MDNEKVIRLLKKLDNKDLAPEEEMDLKKWMLSEEVDFSDYIREDWEKFRLKIKEKAPAEQVKKLNLPGWIKVAAAVLILITAGWYLIIPHTSPITYSAGKGKMEIGLPDESVIIIHPGTTISYDDDFGKKNRKVNLAGLAYFKVAKDKEKPFIIQGPHTTTKVLGTEFYLQDGEDTSAAYLDVMEGKVSIQFDNSDPIIRTPGQRLEYDKKSQEIIEVKVNKNDYYWQSGILIFEETSLTMALETIGIAFDTKITWDSSIEGCILSSTFDNESLEEILTILEITFSTKFERTSDHSFHLKEISCQQQ